MEVVRGITSPVVPPAPLEQNSMGLSEAVDVVNTILGTHYQAFDKLRAVLVAAKRAESDQIDAAAKLSEMNAYVDTAKASLDAVRQQLDQANADMDKSKAAHKMLQADQASDLQGAAAAARDALAAEISATRAKKLEQLDVDTQVANLALAKARSDAVGAESKLDSIATEIRAKTVELANVQARLDSANATLNALRAKL